MPQVTHYDPQTLISDGSMTGPDPAAGRAATRVILIWPVDELGVEVPAGATLASGSVAAASVVAHPGTVYILKSAALSNIYTNTGAARGSTWTAAF